MDGIIDEKSSHGIFWREHVEAWRKTNLSQKDYCRHRNLKLSRFGYWKRKFSKENSTEFVEVRLQDASSSKLSLIIDGNFKIEIPKSFSSETLIKLITTFGDTRCS